MYKMERILVPVDFSPGSRTAATHALRLAGRLGARVRVLHVVPGVSRAAAGARPEVWGQLMTAADEVSRQAERDLGDFVAELRDRSVPPADVELTVDVVKAEDSVPGAIIQAARTSGADLIVMATHGRTGLRRLALGSVAEAVLRAAECPVLTVK